MEALILVGAGAAEVLRYLEGPGVGLQFDWEAIERGVLDNPRGSKDLLAPGIACGLVQELKPYFRVGSSACERTRVGGKLKGAHGFLWTHRIISVQDWVPSGYPDSEHCMRYLT